MKSRRGVTLLEAIVAASILAITALAVMRAIGHSRITRGNAREQQALLLLAQGELDRLRALPASELRAGTDTRHDPAWPATITSTATLESRGDGTWMIDVTLQRETIEGLPPVRLATIRRGGEAP